MHHDKETRFDFIKSSHCREIIVDGVYGGPAPQGRINAVLFIERNHIPASVTHRIGANDATGQEIVSKREMKDGTVRVIETILMLDIDAAKALHEFLGNQIKAMTQSMSSDVTNVVVDRIHDNEKDAPKGPASQDK